MLVLLLSSLSLLHGQIKAFTTCVSGLLGTRKTPDIAVNANKCAKNTAANLAAVLINDPQLRCQVEVSLL